MMPMPPEKLIYWSQIANKYIRPIKEISEKIKKEKRKLFSDTEKIMGVSIRAGYRRAALLNQNIINDHPKVGSCEEFIEIIQMQMNEWGYESFFLACEDREYVTKIEKYFGEKCVHMDRKYLHMFHNDTPVADMDELFQEYEGISIKEKTIEYIIETYLLAECDSLYSTVNGGAEFAYIINGGKYINFRTYNEGLYLIRNCK